MPGDSARRTAGDSTANQRHDLDVPGQDRYRPAQILGSWSLSSSSWRWAWGQREHPAMSSDARAVGCWRG
ncbi:DUF6882 domain-containing protein [Streptomyces sp. NPDC002491]